MSYKLHELEVRDDGGQIEKYNNLLFHVVRGGCDDLELNTFDILHLLPSMENVTEFGPISYGAKIVGSTKPHKYEDEYDRTLFILLDKFDPGASFYFVYGGEFVEIYTYDAIAFEHSEEHAILTKTPWIGISVPFNLKEIEK